MDFDNSYVLHYDPNPLNLAVHSCLNGLSVKSSGALGSQVQNGHLRLHTLASAAAHKTLLLYSANNELSTEPLENQGPCSPVYAIALSLTCLAGLLVSIGSMIDMLYWVILGLYWGNILGIMENKMETTIVYWGYIGIGLLVSIGLRSPQSTAAQGNLVKWPQLITHFSVIFTLPCSYDAQREHGFSFQGLRSCCHHVLYIKKVPFIIHHPHQFTIMLNCHLELEFN